MRVFVDAGPFIAILNKSDPNHENAREQFSKVVGKGKALFTSDYVLDEVLSYAIRKTKNPEIILAADDLIQESANIRVLKVDEEVLTDSKIFMRKHPEMLLSLTDWTSALLARRRAISRIYSYDAGFDRLRRLKEFKRLERVEVL